MLVGCNYSLLSPFAAERDDGRSDSAEMATGTCKPKTLMKGPSREEQDEEEGLTSLVHTTLHGDCRPVMEYGLVSSYY